MIKHNLNSNNNNNLNNNNNNGNNHMNQNQNQNVIQGGMITAIPSVSNLDAYNGINIEIEPSAINKEVLLGEGSFGTVWRGHCHSNQVAIKVPLKQKLSDEQLTSLRLEIKIMRNSLHPNIILFMGACTIPGQFMIVTELLHGDVEKLMQQQGLSMPIFQRILLARDAALGLTWLHKNDPSIIHRDLKTANLLYEKIENSYRVKVCDFGLSAFKVKIFFGGC